MGQLAKAKLIELVPNGDDWTEGSHEVEVQFNPPSLKVRYSNQISGGHQAGGSPKQFVGQSTTSMSIELWWDSAEEGTDVREKTREVAYFIEPKKDTQDGKEVKIPPRVRFLWGSFLFDGIVTGMDESLEYFSESGIPLRASTSVSLSEQAFQFTIQPAGAGGAGTSPTTTAQDGDTMQSIAERNNQASWQDLAEANDIDNPRDPGAGTLVQV